MIGEGASYHARPSKRGLQMNNSQEKKGVLKKNRCLTQQLDVS